MIVNNNTGNANSLHSIFWACLWGSVVWHPSELHDRSKERTDNCTISKGEKRNYSVKL